MLPSRLSLHTRLNVALVLIVFCGCKARTLKETQIGWSQHGHTSEESYELSASSGSSVASGQNDSTNALSETTPSENPFEPHVPPAVPEPMSVGGSPAELSLAERQTHLIGRLEALGVEIQRDGSMEITSIDFTGTTVTDYDVRDLSLLTSLKIISLKDTDISDGGLRHLSQLPKLELLIVSGTQVTDAGFRTIWMLPELRFIAIDDTAVTDAVFVHLAGSRSLEGISLQRTAATAAAAENFRKLNPHCKVILSPEPPSTPSATQEPAAEAPQPLPVEAEATSVRRVELRSQTLLHADNNLPADQGGDFQQILRSRLHDPVLLLAMGDQLMTQQRYPEAVQILATALSVAPHDRQINYQLGIALAHAGDLERGYQHLEAAVGSAAALHDLGVLCVTLGRRIEAEVYFSRALEVDPSMTETQRYLAALRSRRSQIQKPLVLPQLSEAELLGLLNSSFSAPEQGGSTGVTIIPATGSRQ